MSQEIVPTASDPARAFEDLRYEVSLLRRAVQGLTAERQNAPDYLPTLQDIAGRLQSVGQGLKRVEQAPAMNLTPESFSLKINKAAAAARAEDRQLVTEANEGMRDTIKCIDALVERGWTAERQWRQLLWTAAVAFVIGILICAALPHIFASRTAHPTTGSTPKEGVPPSGMP
jgi:hypothetical protein